MPVAACHSYRSMYQRLRIACLCFPDLYLKPIVQTKGSNFFHNLQQTPLWDKFHFVENDWSYIYEIPILYNINLNASFGHITEDGKMTKMDKEVKLQTNLIIQKYKKSGNVHVFLSSVIGYITNPDKPIEGFSPWLWTGDRSNFTGYQFFTHTDGSFRCAFQYKSGKRTDIRLDLYDRGVEYMYPQEVFSINMGYRGTKGVGIYEPSKWCWICQRAVSSQETYCPQCGNGVLDEIIVTPNPDPPGAERCDRCNFLIENCICGEDPGDDDVCPYCGSPNCSGECRETGGEGGGGNGTPTGGEDGSETNENNTVITNLFILDDTSDVVVEPQLEELYKDCFGKNVLISFPYKISFQYDSNLLDMASYSVSNKRVTWNMYYGDGADMSTLRLVLLEELIHAIQYKNNWIHKDTNSNNWMNAEVEAKIAIYKYAKKHNCINSLLKGSAMLSWEEAIEPYLETPSIENYEQIVNFIRSMGGKYMDETKFQDDPTKRTIENISLLLCY